MGRRALLRLDQPQSPPGERFRTTFTSRETTIVIVGLLAFTNGDHNVGHSDGRNCGGTDDHDYGGSHIHVGNRRPQHTRCPQLAQSMAHGMQMREQHLSLYQTQPHRRARPIWPLIESLQTLHTPLKTVQLHGDFPSRLRIDGPAKTGSGFVNTRSQLEK